MLHTSKLGWIAVIIFVASMAVAYGLMSVSAYLSGVGTVKAIGVGVYWDSGCSQAVSSIDWGLTDPGSVKNVTVYVRKEGNAPATFFLEADNWSPVNASSYMTLSWSYNGETVDPEHVVEVTLSLYISPDIEEISSFGFDIIISAFG